MTTPFRILIAILVYAFVIGSGPGLAGPSPGFEKWLLINIVGLALAWLVFYALRDGKQKPVQVASAKQLQTKARIWIAINLVAFALCAFSVAINLYDPIGFTTIVTFPVYVVCACLLLLDAVIFAILAVKTPQENRSLKLGYSAGAALALAPLVLIGSYITFNILMSRAAEDRANTLISNTEARQLVVDCKVETMHRKGSAEMYLVEPNSYQVGGYEKRSFSLSYFDELVAVAWSKEVQDKCGFVPVYDLIRTKQPAVIKWITASEAEAIINKCLWSTHYYSEGYFRMPALPGPNTTGILLSQTLGPWNDDTESLIIMVSDDSELKASLQEKYIACPIDK